MLHILPLADINENEFTLDAKVSPQPQVTITQMLPMAALLLPPGKCPWLSPLQTISEFSICPGFGITSFRIPHKSISLAKSHAQILSFLQGLRLHIYLVLYLSLWQTQCPTLNKTIYWVMTVCFF